MNPQDELKGEIRIGSRGSPLALAQAKEVRSRLLKAHSHLSEENVTIVVISTTGDKIQNKALREFGGKGLFTKEIEEALLSKKIDIAVHSMKDVPTDLPTGLGISTFLPREDPRDGFLSHISKNLEELPLNTTVGSSSMRRAAQIRNIRPDLRVVDFRGNVNTRIRKLSEGEVGATFLACAGLKRLNMADRITSPVPVEKMLPAVAQAVIGCEIRLDDKYTAEILTPLNHSQTAYCVTAERAFLAVLDGSCRTPIAALATLEGEVLNLRAQILRIDGSQCLETNRQGPIDQAAKIGFDAGKELLSHAEPGFFPSDKSNASHSN